MKTHRLVNALLRQPVDKTPVWIMRQAGRYLPEFRELRKKAPHFLDFCKIPELACEATLQPLRRFDLDAAIIFSDILTVVDALGFDLEFVSGQGPVVHNPIRSEADLSKVSLEEAAGRLSYVYQAVKMTRDVLSGKVPLIGFAGSPWTVACYMIEGRNQQNFQTIRQMIYKNPLLLHKLLDQLAQLSILYLRKQIEAGAEVVMLFDSWGGLLSAENYLTFSLDYMQRIAEALPEMVNGQRIPRIFFTKGGGLWLKQLLGRGCDAAGLDWTIDVGVARQQVGDQLALQGNLDPMALYGTTASVREAVRKIIESYGKGSGHVINLGHGIDKATPIENVEAMVSAVREFG